MFDDGVQRGQAQHDIAARGWKPHASMRTTTARQHLQPLAIGEGEQRRQRLGGGWLGHHQRLHAQHARHCASAGRVCSRSSSRLRSD